MFNGELDWNWISMIAGCVLLTGMMFSYCGSEARATAEVAKACIQAGGGWDGPHESCRDTKDRTDR